MFIFWQCIALVLVDSVFLSFSFSFFLFSFFFLVKKLKWTLWDFNFSMFGGKSNIKAQIFFFLGGASDEARGFLEAFHGLLTFIIPFLAALIDLPFQDLGKSPL